VVAPAGTGFSATPFLLSFLHDLGVSIAGAGQVFVGSNLTYTITLSNGGPASAPNVFVTNTLPAGVALKSASTTAGSLDTNANPVIANLGTFGVSASATITLVVAPSLPGTITNMASIVGGYSDPAPANNSAVLATTVLPVPVLSIQIYSQGQVQVSWPKALTDYIPQFNTVFSTNNNTWSNVTTMPFEVGDIKFFIDPIGTTPKYYRLKR
jgi:uncharacterized repeat protein (TIGR01451 family)